MFRRGALVAIVAMAGFLLAAFGPSVSSGPAAANGRTARRDAAALLARLRLPHGAIRSESEPQGGGQALANPASQPGTPNLAKAHAWWVVPGTPAAAISFIRAHPPAGSRLIESGSGTAGRPYQMVGYGWPARLHILATRWLVVEAVSLGDDRTALRADGEVVWITPRPASERVPARVRRLVVSVVRRRRILDGPMSFTAHGPVRKVRALIDGLPAFQPGAFSCPADFGIRVRLAFYGTRRRAMAVALANPGGCGDVQLTIGGRPQPPLTSSAFPGSGRAGLPSLVKQIEAALSIKLQGLNGP
jgi:hypothetical protein